MRKGKENVKRGKGKCQGGEGKMSRRGRENVKENIIVIRTSRL